MKQLLVFALLATSLTACDINETMREKSTQDPTVIQARELGARYGCMGCHTVTNSIMGPAWKRVADRYRDNPDGKALIIDSIKNGSKGRWATESRIEEMPPYHDKIPDNELEILADYILQLK